MSPSTSAPRYCTFQVAGFEIALEVARVLEVLRDPVIRPVPLAPPAIRGLLNLRGQVVTALDLRTLLGLGEDGRPAVQWHAVVEDGDALVSIVVDEAGDVIRPDPDSPTPLPSDLPAALRRAVRSPRRHDGRVLLVLDLDTLLDLDGGAP